MSKHRKERGGVGDFGAGVSAVLHGPEEIIPRPDGPVEVGVEQEAVAAAVVEGLARGSEAVEQALARCDRATAHDSLRWHCACGAAGPVGRTADGIPFITPEMLEHFPGQQKESA